MSHLQTGRAVPIVSKRQNWFKGRELTERQDSSGPSKMLGKADDICKAEKEIVIAVGWWSKVELKEEFG